MSDTPRVFVQCLGCYNAGALTGRHFDATEAPTTMAEFDAALGFDEAARQRNIAEHGIEIKGVPFSPDHGHPVYGPHEELWVTDHDGFGGFLRGECSPYTAVKIAEMIEAIKADGHDVAAVAAWAEYAGETLTEWDAPTESSFTDAFEGHHESDEAFAQDWFDEMVKGQYTLVAGLDSSKDFNFVERKHIADPVETWPFNHIDWDSATDDLMQGFHSAKAPDGGVFIFSY